MQVHRAHAGVAFARFALGSVAASLLMAASFGAQATVLDKTVDLQLRGRVEGAQFGAVLNAQADLDRDGQPDLIVGSPAGPGFRGAVDVFKGGPNGAKGRPMFHYEGQMDWAQVGSSVLPVDVNGDGWMDLLVGAANQSGAVQYSGAVLVFLGSSKGFPAQPSQILEGKSTNAFYGWKMLSLGDFDGDGKADVGITAIGANDGLGAIYIHRGSASGLEATPAQVLVGAAPWLYFGRVADSGDTNGDGIADIVVGAPSPVGGIPGMAWVYLGSRSGYTNTKSETLFSPVTLNDSDSFGDNIKLLGDVDGDGHADLAVAATMPFSSSTGSGLIAVYYGSGQGFAASGRTQVIKPRFSDTLTHLGANMLGRRDVDGDGHADLVVGSSDYGRPSDGSDYPGEVWFYRGSSAGLSARPNYKIAGQGNDELGTSLEVSDVNGDGLQDLVAGSGYYTGRLPHDGIVRIFLGAKPGSARR